MADANTNPTTPEQKPTDLTNANAETDIDLDVDSSDKPPKGWEKHVQDLRKENQTRRLQMREIEAKQKAAEAAVEGVKASFEQKLADAKKSADERVIKAELKALAAKAGMVDLDGLRLADVSKVTLSDDGAVIGADEAIKAFKEAKPFFFETKKESSTLPGGAPNPAPATSKLAKDMTPEEYKAAKAALVRQGRGY